MAGDSLGCARHFLASGGEGVQWGFGYGVGVATCFAGAVRRAVHRASRVFAAQFPAKTLCTSRLNILLLSLPYKFIVMGAQQPEVFYEVWSIFRERMDVIELKFGFFITFEARFRIFISTF